MKKSEIKVGGVYRAKVNGTYTTVRVTDIQDVKLSTMSKTVTRYSCVNLKTARNVTFRSALKFLSVAPGYGVDGSKGLLATDAINRGEKFEGGSVMTAPMASTEDDGILWCEATEVDCCENEAGDAECPGCGRPVRPAEGKQNSDPISCSSSMSARSDNRIPAILPMPQNRSYGQEENGAAASTANTPTTTTVSTPLASLLKKSLAEATTAPHLVVEARAGTGKTTTLVEGLKRVKGIHSALVPSPQQEAVWQAMELSRGQAETICFVAFNKSIATELQSRVPTGCDAMTMHSMGLKAVSKAFNRPRVSDYRVEDIIASITGKDVRDLRKEDFVMVQATKQLVGLCKMNLTDYNRPEEIMELAAHYEVELNGSREKVLELVPKVLERCKDVSRDNTIDFSDMIWLPVILNLPVYRYDLLLVDEAQDLNRCQQALAKKAGRRLILCGDPKQAIYGFAGADAMSMPRMVEELSVTPAGCTTLPLTVTRRCGKAIVKEAQKYVPDFDAFEANPEGKISTAQYKESGGVTTGYHHQVFDGDFILCRVNAPLVSQCFKFLRMGRKANIQGRDIGQGLISTVKKMKAGDVTDLVSKISDWVSKEVSKEQAKRSPNENRIIAIQDRGDCITCFTEGLDSVEAVIAKIESIFTDDKKSPGIKLSSIHKAKGLESKRVFFLQPKGATCPHPMAKSAWQVEQEYNLLYVGITRAIEELIFVS